MNPARRLRLIDNAYRAVFREGRKRPVDLRAVLGRLVDLAEQTANNGLRRQRTPIWRGWVRARRPLGAVEHAEIVRGHFQAYTGNALPPLYDPKRWRRARLVLEESE